MKQRPLWFLLNPYGWLILILSIVTAFILNILLNIGAWWVILLGVVGYQTVLLVELTLGRSLGRTGMVRLARAEQENRDLQAEQARLLGTIKELDEQVANLKRTG